MNQQHYHSSQPQRYELPDFTTTPHALLKRLAGLELETAKLVTELEHRGYSVEDTCFVILREVSAVLHAEYAALFDSSHSLDPTAFFQALAGLRDRLTARCNARLQQIVDTKLPPHTQWAIAERKILDLTDSLLPAKRGYLLAADPSNTAPIEVQIDVTVTTLAPGQTFKVPHGTKLNVWGAGQTIRWARNNPPAKTGTLGNAIPMPAKLKAIEQPKRRSLFNWRRPK